MLDVQYRMLEKIAAWPLYESYENKLQTAALLQIVGKHLAGFPWSQQSPLALVNVRGEVNKVESSFRNNSEV